MSFLRNSWQTAMHKKEGKKALHLLWNKGKATTSELNPRSLSTSSEKSGEKWEEWGLAWGLSKREVSLKVRIHILKEALIRRTHLGLGGPPDRLEYPCLQAPHILKNTWEASPEGKIAGAHHFHCLDQLLVKGNCQRWGEWRRFQRWHLLFARVCDSKEQLNSMDQKSKGKWASGGKERRFHGSEFEIRNLNQSSRFSQLTSVPPQTIFNK